MKYTSNITEFILLGLSQSMKIKHVCFLLVLFCYIAIWMKLARHDLYHMQSAKGSNPCISSLITLLYQIYVAHLNSDTQS